MSRSKSAEVAITLRSNDRKLSSSELEKLDAVFSSGSATPWLTLPNGYFVWTVKGSGNWFFILISDETHVVGYLKLYHAALATRPILKGWEVRSTFLRREFRGQGIMRRVYDRIIDKGRLFSSREQSKSGMRMWVERIRTDSHRHAYFVFDGQDLIRIRGNNIDTMLRLIWNDDPYTILVAMPLKDPSIKRLGLDND